MLTRRMLVLATGTAAAMLTLGCQMDTHKNSDGKEVKIETPIGGLQVTTNEATVLEQIGLPAYPGAQSVKKDKDDGAADVHMRLGRFQFGLKAVSYTTPDAPGTVEAFYRGQLKRYGDVIECKNDQPVGTPTRTFEGLTCDPREAGHVTVDDHPDKNELELRTGSKQHQRIVSIEPHGNGTKFGLVVLDLPKRMADSEDDDTRP